MAKSKMKRKYEEEEESPNIPIPNLPKKFLWMHVKSGTKIRNVLGHAIKEFPQSNSVVWSGAGQGIGKVISCAELLKRKYPGLHQITKLRYIKSKNSSPETTDAKNEPRQVPEMHILLTKNVLDSKEPGYQAAGDSGTFWKAEGISEIPKRKEQQAQSSSKMSNIATEEFAAMGLRTGQKRPRKGPQAEAPLKKNKKKGKDNR